MAERAPQTLRVVQLNAGSLLEPGWEERRHAVVAWIDHLDPDVVCLQEVWRDGAGTDTAGWVVDRLDGEWHHVFGGGHIAPELWPDTSLEFGSAIVSRWPIDASTCHLLPVVAGAPPMVAGVPWELLHVHTAGLDVWSTHLTAAPTDGDHRLLQVQAIDDHVRAERGDRDTVVFGQRRSGMPPIVCGDFNAEPDSDEIRWLRGLTDIDGRRAYWVDAWSQAGDGPGLTSDPAINPIAADMGVARKRIDHVFVGDGFQRDGGAGRVLAAEVAFDDSLTGIVASDHLGLVVDLRWPDRPS